MGVMKDYDRRIRQGGDDAIAAAGELMPRWIPVAERLPPDEELVLCADIASDEDGVIDHDFVVAYRVHGRWATTRGDRFGEWAMTHWMPLPAPPEVTP